jgi:N-acetylglutamate synthase-like GNAT family acetyltransferase
MKPATIREARPADNLAIRQLILRILNEEYAMALTLAELPDLGNVYETYRINGGGQFWVVEQDGRIVGCIGLMRLGRGDYELRRMYVQAAARGQGLAQRLLDLTHGWARRHGVRALYLETNEQWHAAQHLYAKNGYAPIAQSELPPEFPIVRVATGFYRLDLDPEARTA